MWLGYHFQGQKVKGRVHVRGGGILWRPTAYSLLILDHCPWQRYALYRGPFWLIITTKRQHSNALKHRKVNNNIKTQYTQYTEYNVGLPIWNSSRLPCSVTLASIRFKSLFGKSSENKRRSLLDLWPFWNPSRSRPLCLKVIMCSKFARFQNCLYNVLMGTLNSPRTRTKSNLALATLRLARLRIRKEINKLKSPQQSDAAVIQMLRWRTVSSSCWIRRSGRLIIATFKTYRSDLVPW